jgi:hypothetical protein
MGAVGRLLFWACGLAVIVFETIWFYRWWGLLGAIVSVFIPPLALVFPFVYLAREGFSALYFGLWGLGLVGLFIAARDQ